MLCMLTVNIRLFINISSFSFFLLGTHEALDHLASVPSSGETISRRGIEPLTTPFNFGTSPLSPSSLGSSWTNYVFKVKSYIYYDIKRIALGYLR